MQNRMTAMKGKGDRLQPGLIHTFIFTSYAHFANDGFYLFFPLLVAYYSKIPDINVSILGSMAVIYYLLSGFLSPKIGKLADRLNRDAMLLSLGIGIYAIAALVLFLPFVFIHYFYVLVVIGIIFLSFAYSFFHPIGATIISQSFRERAPTLLGINGSMGSLGRSVMAGVFVLLVAAYGIETGMFSMAAFALISAMIIYTGLRTFRRESKIQDNKPVHKSVDGAHKAQKASKSIRAVKAGVGSKAHPAGPATDEYKGFIKLFVAIAFLIYVFIASTVLFVPKYLDLILHSTTLAGEIVSFSFFFAVFGQLVFGYVTSKRGGKFSVSVTTAFSSIAFAAFLLAGSNVIVLTIAYSLFTFFAFTGFPVLLGYVNQIVPRSISSEAGSKVWGIGQYLGAGSGIAVISVLIYFIGIRSALWSMLIFVIPALILILFLPKRKSNAVIGSPSH